MCLSEGAHKSVLRVWAGQGMPCSLRQRPCHRQLTSATTRLVGDNRTNWVRDFPARANFAYTLVSLAQRGDRATKANRVRVRAPGEDEHGGVAERGLALDLVERRRPRLEGEFKSCVRKKC
jgi:hypothetical protein